MLLFTGWGNKRNRTLWFGQSNGLQCFLFEVVVLYGITPAVKYRRILRRINFHLQGGRMSCSEGYNDCSQRGRWKFRQVKTAIFNRRVI